MTTGVQTLISNFFTAIINDDVETMTSLVDSPDSSAVFADLAIIRHPASRLSPVHIAAFSGADECLVALLQRDRDRGFPPPQYGF